MEKSLAHYSTTLPVVVLQLYRFQLAIDSAANRVHMLFVGFFLLGSTIYVLTYMKKMVGNRSQLHAACAHVPCVLVLSAACVTHHHHVCKMQV